MQAENRIRKRKACELVNKAAIAAQEDSQRAAPNEKSKGKERAAEDAPQPDGLPDGQGGASPSKLPYSNQEIADALRTLRRLALRPVSPSPSDGSDAADTRNLAQVMSDISRFGTTLETCGNDKGSIAKTIHEWVRAVL